MVNWRYGKKKFIPIALYLYSNIREHAFPTLTRWILMKSNERLRILNIRIVLRKYIVLTWLKKAHNNYVLCHSFNNMIWLWINYKIYYHKCMDLRERSRFNNININRLWNKYLKFSQIFRCVYKLGEHNKQIWES